MKMSFGSFVECVTLIAFLLGAYKHFVWKEPGKCAMTYMYQMPQYIPIRLPKIVTLQFPYYGLYVYGEGSYARSLANGNFNGIPVLFLPGNSGSYKQVRSLASVSLTKADENRTPFHFNYFAADFNEELSALYGNFLIKQTEFVSICIRTILDLYKDGPNSPKSVIVVGHSMGGLIARALFTLPHFNSETVRVIVTQATPHLEPVFSSDLQMDAFYSRVDDQWSPNRRNGSSSSSSSSTMRNVNVVSIGGGPLDLMVRPDLVALSDSDMEMSSSHVSLMSNAIPGVWIGMDHLCIVWCNQLVLATVRTIFKLIDPTTKQLIKESRRRQDIIDSNFIRGHHKTRTVKMPQDWAVPLAYEELWTDRSTRRWEYDGKEETSALLITTFVGEDLVFVASNLDLEPWIFGCVPDDGRAICYVSHPLSCENTYLPTKSGVTKAVYCRNVRETHVVIKLEANSDHDIKVSVESFPTLKSSFEVSSWWSSLVADQTFTVRPGSLFAKLRIPGLSEKWQAYTLRVHTSEANCKHGILHVFVPWAKEDTFTVIDDVITIHSLVLYSQRPKRVSKGSVEVRFYLDPSCSYDVTVTYSLMNMIQQAIRFYIHLVPAFISASILGNISSQISHLEPKRFLSVNLSRPLRNLTIVYVSVAILRWSFPDTILDQFVIVSKHYDRGWSFPVLYFLYVVSAAMTSLSSTLICFSLIPTRKLFSRLRKDKRFGFRSSRRISFVINMILVSLLAIVTYFTCGILSLLATQLIFMIKLFYHELKGEEKTNRTHKLYATCYLLWSVVFVIHCPTLVVWILNLRFRNLSPDPSLILSCIMLISLLGKANFVDYFLTTKSPLLSRIQTVLSLLILVFGLERIYVIGWLLAADCFLLAFWPIQTTVDKHQ